MRQHGSKNSRADRQGSASSSQSTRVGSSDEEAILPVVVIGLGAIGLAVASAALQHPDLDLVGVADPAHAGKSLRDLLPGAPELPIAERGASVYKRARGGVALICTSSLLEEVAEEIDLAIQAGLHVVSSCEELANAPFVDPDLAEELDRAAQEADVAILGTGVNPGFVLDRLPATLGAVVGEVRRVDALRVIDLASSRASLQRKFGLGLDAAEFERLVEEGVVGHVGLSESCGLLAEGLALEVDEIEEAFDPILATETIVVGDHRIEAGLVQGIRQVAMAFEEGREVARITLEAGLALPNPRDWFRIEADPPIEVLIPGGIPGEKATAWSIVNAAPRVASAEPGLLTVLDLPAGR